MHRSDSITNTLRQSRLGCEDARERVGRWLLDHIRARVEAAARRQPLPDSVSAIGGDVLVKLLNSGILNRAPNQQYLIGATTRALVEVIADTARRMNRQKRGPRAARLPEEMLVNMLHADGLEVPDLTDAIKQLASLNELGARRARVVTLRYLGGMRVAEIADALDISKSTVEADWRAARAWLFKKLCVDDAVDEPDSDRNRQSQ